jgi:hypothetical protein
VSTTAKVKLDRKHDQTIGKPGEEAVDQVTLYFGADYENGANKEWAKYTPSISVTMTVKPEIAERFNVGDKFTLIFDEHTEAEHVFGDPVQGSLEV